MKSWELDEVRRAVKGKWLMRGEKHRLAFNGKVCTDSRKATAGDLFIAIKGEKFDAHDFLRDVIDREVAAVLVHREPSAELLTYARDKGVSLLIVDDTVAAMNRLAAAYRQSPGFRAKVIAVGGSNGKTTTKRIIHALLAEKFGAAGGHASPKSFNNNIGMPLTLLEVSPSHEYVVLEIGTNAPGEIAALGEVSRPDVAVITSVGLEHLEKLGDLEGVAHEEASIVPFVADRGTLVLPADAPELLKAVKGGRGTKVQKILVGKKANAGGAAPDLVLTDVAESLDGTQFSINGRGEFLVPLLGEHNAMNALLAIAVARRLGVSDAQIVAGLAKVKAAEGRMEPMTIGDWPIIHDAYNANPTSMEAALRTFATLTESEECRRVVVLGDMLELGISSEAMHRAVGAQVAAWGFDVFIAIGSQMRHAAKAAEAASDKAKLTVKHFADTAAARAGIKKMLESDDAILFKGSHGMALETLLEVLRDGMDKGQTNGNAAQRRAKHRSRRAGNATATLTKR